MDIWRIEPQPEDRVAASAVVGRFGAAGLSLRLTSLRHELERAFPAALALDIANGEAADGLSPELTAILHSLAREAALQCAAESRATLIRLSLQTSDNSVRLCIEDDGAGFAFKGAYEAGELLAFGVGPQSLAHQVIACGGRLKLDSRRGGSRLEIVLPRTLARPPTSIMPVRAAAG